MRGIIAIPKTGDYGDREAEIYRDLVKAVAERDSLNLTHARSKFTAESTADELLKHWTRHRREPANEIERLCEANYQNNQDWMEYRRELQAIRDAQAKATAQPEPDPSIITWVEAV
jgi:hypothetical protein